MKMSTEEEIIQMLKRHSLEELDEILNRLKSESLLEPSDNMQAAVRTVFQLFCKEDNKTFTNFGAEETEENPWSSDCPSHRCWLEITEDMMKSCNIETAEEMIECLSLMLDIIKSTNRVKHKNEKAFGLYIYHISREATDIDHLKSPEYWSEEKKHESYDNLQGEGTEVQ